MPMRMRFATIVAAGLFVIAAAASPAAAANIVVINVDGAGEGLNDPTPVSPVGGNSGTTRGAQRLLAVEHAASIWAAILESNITVRIDTRFDPLVCSLTEAELGFGGPITWVTLNIPNALPDTWYPIALGNKLRNLDINFFLSEIQLTLSDRFDTGCAFPRTWYYGLDGAGDPATTIDLVSAAVREIGHGLGFNTFVDVTTGARVDNKNDIFMHFLEDLTTGKTWAQMSNAERVASATNTGNVVWNGPRVTAAASMLSSGTNAGKVIMHTPDPVDPGLSLIHWDPSVSPDELMEPSLDATLQDPSLARALMVDLGWTLATCGDGVVDIGEYCDAAQECCTSACDIAPSGTACDDGFVCNGTETCDAFGGCTGPSTGDPCPSGPVGDNCSLMCDEGLGGCFAPFPDGTACDDGDICTASAECLSGVCVGDDSENLCSIDAYLGYKSRAPRRDPLGQSIVNSLLRPWVIKVDDYHLPDTDADDPENFEVRTAAVLLNPALQNADTILEDPDLHYLSYQMRTGKEGIGEKLPNGRFPRPARHIPRTWQLSNDFGTVSVISTKVQGLLLPTNTSSTPLPPTPPDDSHFACYKVKTGRDVTDQTPDSGGGAGRFRKDMQGFFADEFEDCVLSATGGPSFPSTPVQGRCLLDLRRITEFCSPIEKNPVDPDRVTAATGVTTSPTKTDLGLLCYQVKLATKVNDPTVAAVLGVAVGERVTPKQSKHAKRGFRSGTPVYTKPGNGFMAPPVVETTKLDSVCLPTEVLSVSPMP